MATTTERPGLARTAHLVAVPFLASHTAHVYAPWLFRNVHTLHSQPAPAALVLLCLLGLFGGHGTNRDL